MKPHTQRLGLMSLTQRKRAEFALFGNYYHYNLALGISEQTNRLDPQRVS